MKYQGISELLQNASTWVKNFPDRAKTVVDDYSAKSAISLPFILNDFYAHFGKSNETHRSKMNLLSEPLRTKIKASGDILLLTGVLALGISVLLLCSGASLFTSLVPFLVGLAMLLLLNHQIINTELFKTEFHDQLAAITGENSSLVSGFVIQVGQFITRIREATKNFPDSIKEVFSQKETNPSAAPPATQTVPGPSGLDREE
jgi:hypothetical protein